MGRVIIAVGVLLFSLSGCPDEHPPKQVTEREVTAACALLGCKYENKEEDPVAGASEACSRVLLQLQDSMNEDSTECGDRYARFVACVAPLSCAEFGSLSAGRGNPCEDAEDEFVDACTSADGLLNLLRHAD